MEDPSDGAREVGPNGKPLDYCWEALVEETQAVPEIERGNLNTALLAIRACCQRDGLHPDSIPDEIRLRARTYRSVMNGCTLTPMALAKHWRRCLPQTASVTAEESALASLRHPQHGKMTL